VVGALGHGDGGGLSANGAAMRGISRGERLADELGSPVLRCWMAEIAIEYAVGDRRLGCRLALLAHHSAGARAGPASTAAAAARLGGD